MKLLAPLSIGLVLVAYARAGTPMPVKMKCAVGGERFTYISTASMSQWGSRPDGKPYGSWTFPMPLPECPGNGLVMYRDFTKSEVKALKPLLATREYRQLVTDRETPYYRAHWLMEKLGDAPLDGAWVLLQASWEADADPDRKRRYQDEFVQRAQSLAKPEAGQDDLGWMVVNLRAVNALRELGRFDSAVQVLDALPLTTLDVPIPQEKVSGTTASGLGKQIENYGEIQAAQSRRAWMKYAERMRAAIARHDDSSEPIDLVPLRVAASLCATHSGSTPAYREVCESDAMRAQLEKPKKIRELTTPAPPSPATPPPATDAKPD